MVGRVCKCRKDKGYCYIKDNLTGNTYFCQFANTYDGILENGYLVDFHVFYDWKHDVAKAKDVKVIEAWQ